MPYAPKRHGEAQVDASRKAARKAYEATPDRKEAMAFYNSARWRKLRALFLQQNPLCSHCEKTDRVVPAVHVHHVQPRKTHPHLELDSDNLEGLCIGCHSRLEALARGGVGGLGPRGA